MIQVDPIQLAKLPKWAREVMQELRRELANKEETIVSLQGTNEVSCISYHDGEQPKIYLPEHVTLEYTNDPNGIIRVHVYVDYTNKLILHISADHTIEILPMAANCFDVKVGVR